MSVQERVFHGGRLLGRIGKCFLNAHTGTPWERICWLTAHLYPGEPLGKRPAFFFVMLHALTHEDVYEHVRE